MNPTIKPVSEFRIEPAGMDWAYPILKQDYLSDAKIWREVTQDFFHQALNVMPPIYVGAGFMVGEAYTHDDKTGKAIFAGFIQVGNRHFARYATKQAFHEELRQVLSLLGKC
jgi:hypothetical protein